MWLSRGLWREGIPGAGGISLGSAHYAHPPYYTYLRYVA
jgi:hypothetical protein